MTVSSVANEAGRGLLQRSCELPQLLHREVFVLVHEAHEERERDEDQRDDRPARGHGRSTAFGPGGVTVVNSNPLHHPATSGLFCLSESAGVSREPTPKLL